MCVELLDFLLRGTRKSGSILSQGKKSISQQAEGSWLSLQTQLDLAIGI
jgi:hypothetical protein